MVLTRALTVLLMALIVVPVGLVNAQVGSFEVLIVLPSNIVDVAVSPDGRFVAAVNASMLMYFSVATRSLQWTFTPASAGLWSVMDILSVRISADGECVVIGYGNNLGEGGISFFKQCTGRTGTDQPPTWTNWFLKQHGRIERRSMDISDDGETVAVAGTGDTVYYFSRCVSASRAAQATGLFNWTFGYVPNIQELLCLDMVPSGRLVASGGYCINGTVYVVYLDNLTLNHLLWHKAGPENGTVNDIAVSNDGYGLAAAIRSDGPQIFTGVVYYEDANQASVPASIWKSGENSETDPSVAMSGDGNLVACGTYSAVPATLFHWSGARAKPSGTATADWTLDYEVLDADMSGDGSVIAILTREGESEWFLRVLDGAGNERANYALDSEGEVVSMSGDGQIIGLASATENTLVVARFRATVGGEILETTLLAQAVALLLAMAVVTSVVLLRRKKF